MEIISNILAFTFVLLLSILIYAACLWVGMKSASIYAGMKNGGQYCEYPDLVKVAAATGVVSVIPYAGFIASWVVLFYLLHKETEAEALEIVIMVVVAQFTKLALFILLAPIL